MSIHRFIVRFNHIDPRSARYLSDARALGFDNLQRIECQDIYFIESQLSQEGLQHLALKLLTDPVTQTATWDELPAPHIHLEEDPVLVEVALRPGVTDPVAHEIVRAAHELGLDEIRRAATGLRFLLFFDKSASIRNTAIQSAEQLVKRLLANPTVQHWNIGEIEPTFPLEAESSGTVEIFELRTLTDTGLQALSRDRRAALDLEEMKAVQNYCRKEKRDLTDVEFETIAQTWS